MTDDNEIIKALECCKTDKSCDKCEYEPTEHQIGTVGCSHELMKDALDLINRQKAEIERLSAKSRDNDRQIKALKDDLNLANEDIEMKKADI